MNEFNGKMIVSLVPNNKTTSIHNGFCKGAYLLLKGVEENGSLYASAKNLGMAYSKAWKLIKDVGYDFDTNLVMSFGPHGSEITEDARKLISEYEHLREEANIITDR